MLGRRSFIKCTGAGLALSLSGCGGNDVPSENDRNTRPGATVVTIPSDPIANNTPIGSSSWFMPDESVSHRCTWMAFGAQSSIWGSELLPAVQDNLALIARTLAEHEPVRMLVREADQAVARAKCGDSVELVTVALDDAWIRDSGPVFVQNEKGVAGAVDFNFNGWGNKQAHHHDAGVAAAVIRKARVQGLDSTLVLEGGAIEVDGEGTAIITESCVLNPNRNPGVTKAQVEQELGQLLGLEKIIWLPGIAGRDITDGHTDFYARFVAPGAIVAALEPDPQQYDYQVTRQHLALLRDAVDARGRKLDVVTLEGPQTVRPAFDSNDFAAGYINFYVANDVVLVPQFGDANADARAQLTLQELFPTRQVRALNIDALAAGGGGIHCVTQQEPLV